MWSKWRLLLAGVIIFESSAFALALVGFCDGDNPQVLVAGTVGIMLRAYRLFWTEWLQGVRRHGQ